MMPVDQDNCSSSDESEPDSYNEKNIHERSIISLVWSICGVGKAHEYDFMDNTNC